MRGFVGIFLVSFVLLVGFSNVSTAQVKEVQFGQLKQYLNKQNDTLYVINFWATWCKPCVAEIPYFQRISSKYKDQNVAVILVSLDFSKNLKTKVIPFVKKRDFDLRVFFLHQPRGDDWMSTLSPEWSGAIPATLFIKNSGEQKAFYEKKMKYAEINTIVKQMK